MARPSGRALRIGAGILVLWMASALIAWGLLDPAPTLVGARAAGVRATDQALLERLDLSDEKHALEKANVWGMQRDGQEVVVPPPTVTVEKKIVWNVAASVVRPKERYLLIMDQSNRAISRINEGEKLPDDSKLLQVALNAYTVRLKNGKKLTVETSF